jgi:hypothetical protein
VSADEPEDPQDPHAFILDFWMTHACMICSLYFIDACMISFWMPL